MHGRLKVKTSEEQLKEKLIEKQKKLHKFQLICSDAFQKRNESSSLSVLAKTGEVLISNPDLYTFWNIRKEVLLSIKENSPDEANELLKKELNFLNECLKANPKSYGSWEHRCFIMKTMDMPDWKEELSLCTKFLEIDDRNFHCWDYRRFIIKMSGEPLESELDFTSAKISADFSNFSSWHYRSKLILELHSTNSKSGQVEESTLSNELCLVENAIFTDPNDQSGWFYHRWLIGKKEHRLSIEGVYVDRRIGKLMLLLSSPFQIPADEFVKVEMNGEEKKFCWKTATGRKFCKLIVAELNPKDMDLLGSEGCELNVELCGPLAEEGNSSISCKLQLSNAFFSYAIPHASYDNSPLTQSVLEKQCASLRELHILEPDNKWTLRALTSLMKSIESNPGEVIEYLNKLIVLDPFRTNHYKDLISRLKIEERIKKVDIDVRSISFASLSLTSARCLERLCQMKSVDFSHNNITALEEAYFLQFTEVLILHHNNISDCTGICCLPELLLVDLSDNDIKNTQDLLPLSSCPKLETLLLVGNPITCIPGYEELIKTIIPSIKQFD